MIFHKLYFIISVIIILILTVTSQSISVNVTENGNNEQVLLNKVNVTESGNNEQILLNKVNVTESGNNEQVLLNKEVQVKIARPSVDGQLHVEGTMLVNSKGEKVVLKGLSSHGLTWYADYINEELFTFLSKDWGINIIRLSMYSEDYIKNEKENLKILHRGINAAIASDMYVLIDWNILKDYNPMMNAVEAKTFFSSISEEYANKPNLIFEICNEINESANWENLQEYSKIIIPAIRQHSPNSVVIVGTPNYDHDLKSALDHPINFKNVMYALHFYTASDHDNLMNVLENAIQGGLPVFVTECSITVDNGDGRRDYEYAVKWFDLLSKHHINFVFWNLSNKKISSSIIKASSRECTDLSDDNDLTDTGKWIRSLFKGMAPSEIPQGDTYQKYSFWESILSLINAIGGSNDSSFKAKNYYINVLVLCSGIILFSIGLFFIYSFFSKRKCWTYDQFIRKHGLGDVKAHHPNHLFLKFLLVIVLLTFTLIYLTWRMIFTINKKDGPLPIICNVMLLVVETVGFFETCVLYIDLLKSKKNPLPTIEDDEFPEVDIFIATYNEPVDLLKKTINGCKHLSYPDQSKVHIWLCDDGRRISMKNLARDMNVGYFDRPDNKGAKAGNLNNALAQTSSPYVVTIDADMIVRSDFLLKTLPYFVYVEKCNSKISKEHKKRHLGFLQTPQCFYDPDIFQYNLYSERKVNNEQDFFYQVIEVSRTSSNSVIYAGSNTVLSRKALNDIGGFYTKSITEDFATGLLIQSKGYLSLATSEPLASGMTPNNFDDHIKQRTRWARGVITLLLNKTMNPLWKKNLHLLQRLNYISSVLYWYSPIKNLIYIISPFFFAIFGLPVFTCTPLDIVLYFLPMYLLQYICLQMVTNHKASFKWGSIYEMSVMPFLILPVLKETFGISKTKFKVTNKSNNKIVKNKGEYLKIIPFFIIACLSVVAVIRIFSIIDRYNVICMAILLFWLMFNLYTIVMIILLIQGRKSDKKKDRDGYEYENSGVVVHTNEIVKLKKADGNKRYAITSVLTEHTIAIYLNNDKFLSIGDKIDATVKTDKYKTVVKCVVTELSYINGRYQSILDILSYENEGDYLQILYDRIPTLPQTINRDSFLTLIMRNIFYRALRIFSCFSVEKLKSKSKSKSKPIDNIVNLKIVID